MISLTLENSKKRKTWDLLEVPLGEEIFDNVAENRALSNRTSYYVVGKRKQKWSHTWRFVTREEYAEIREFYDQQILNGEVVRLSISEFSIENVPVRMKIGKREVISNDGLVSSIGVEWKEI